MSCINCRVKNVYPGSQFCSRSCMSAASPKMCKHCGTAVADKRYDYCNVYCLTAPEMIQFELEKTQNQAQTQIQTPTTISCICGSPVYAGSQYCSRTCRDNTKTQTQTQTQTQSQSQTQTQTQTPTLISCTCGCPVYPGSQYCSRTCRDKLKMCCACGSKAVYPGSQYCSISCRDNTRVQQLCRECNSIAYFDENTKTYAPGCCRSHTQMALSKGFQTAR